MTATISGSTVDVSVHTSPDILTVTLEENGQKITADATPVDGVATWTLSGLTPGAQTLQAQGWNVPAGAPNGTGTPVATVRITVPTPTTTPTTTTPTTTNPTTTTPSSTPEPIGIPGNWNLTLDSEFNGPSLDTSIWHTGWFGSGVTDPTNSYEEDCYSPSNVTFPGDGTMHLNVTATPSTCGGETRPYTGSLVSTNPDDGAGGGFQFTYGVVEARVYLPADGNQIANWPAVWTDGQVWPQDGEDDLLEGLGGQACYHFHDPLGGPGNCDTSIAPG